jgi:hypothetical protein
MSGIVILPPQYVAVEGTLVFLAGPIQGAPDWQDRAIHFFHDLAPDFHLACPRGLSMPAKFDYAAQVDWETHHLRLAAQQGAILFWLAREVYHRCDRAYAQTTRFELAEWKVRHERDGVRLVVGIDEGFSGARYIRHRLGQDCPGIPMVESLEAACRAAVMMLTA